MPLVIIIIVIIIIIINIFFFYHHHHHIIIIVIIIVIITIIISTLCSFFPVPPEFLDVPQNEYARIGTSVTFPCAVYSIPSSTVTWKRRGDDVTPATRPDQSHMTIDHQGLTVADVNEEDSGMYQCFASNPWGNIQATAQLVVIPDGKFQILFFIL